ncbi:hypothetical protein ACFL2F_03335 [Myxococcota bacterium]
MKRFLCVLMVAALAFAACSDDGDKICTDANCLNGALAGAESGSTVRVGAGTIEGNFTVPAGVVLAGAGSGSTILKAAGAGPVIEVTADGSGTAIRDLSVEGGSTGGIYVSGDGALTLSDLAISVTGGFCVKVQEIGSLTAENLELSGNVTREVQGTIQAKPNGDLWALAGLAVVKVGSADLKNINATGFASCGVLLHRTPTVWDGGEMRESVGSGVHVDGQAQVTLKNVSSHDIWGGATPYGYGFVASNQAEVLTEGAIARDNDVAGMLFDHATGEHTDAVVTGNQSRGVWIQYCGQAGGDPSVIFKGTGTDLDGNRGVAFGVFYSAGVSLSDAHINGTLGVNHIPYGLETGMVQIGDAIEITFSGELAFKDLVLDNNTRAGVVVDGRDEDGNTGHETSVLFENVKISGDGERGFASQHGTATSAPEVITPALQDADALGGILDVARGLGVGNVPAPDNIIEIPT